VVNLSAGTYTRENWAPLGFFFLHERHHELTLVAAAGNDSTDREFFPAALDWVVGVGSIGADRQHRAWFSNYGDWVNVYAPGEGLVNAYATGEYTYHEPPKRPARQDFTGMARWDGTSFSAPMVAGLIAAEISGTGDPAPVATGRVLAAAQPVDDVGQVLFP
jgi:Subtilase family